MTDAAVLLLYQLEDGGLHLRVREDGQLGVSPSNRLSPEQTRGIRAHKAELTDLLRLRVQVERIWPLASRPDSEQPQRAANEAHDLGDLLVWWEQARPAMIPPITLAKGVLLTDLDTFARWLKSASKVQACEQLRWLKRAVDERKGNDRG